MSKPPQQNEEYAKFDQTMRELLKVPHSEIKAKLEEEKAEKAKAKKDNAGSHEQNESS